MKYRNTKIPCCLCSYSFRIGQVNRRSIACGYPSVTVMSIYQIKISEIIVINFSGFKFGKMS